MDKEINLETYLIISENKFEIYMFDTVKLENVYKNEFNFKNNFLDYEILKNFLDENILKIEKLIGKFVKNIFVIIENNQLLQLQIGIKKKNYQNNNNLDFLKSLLIETKELFQKNYNDQRIMHMTINNYFIDGTKINSFERDTSFEDLSLVVNFASIPVNLSNELEKVLERYQININKYLHKQYVNNFFKDQSIKFPLKIFKILSGDNVNEVHLMPKIEKNRGFFEKFFQLFG